MGQNEQVDIRKKFSFKKVHYSWVLEEVGEITVMIFRKTALRYGIDATELPILWQLISLLDKTTLLGSSLLFSISEQGQ